MSSTTETAQGAKIGGLERGDCAPGLRELACAHQGFVPPGYRAYTAPEISFESCRTLTKRVSAPQEYLRAVAAWRRERDVAEARHRTAEHRLAMILAQLLRTSGVDTPNPINRESLLHLYPIYKGAEQVTENSEHSIVGS